MKISMHYKCSSPNFYDVLLNFFALINSLMRELSHGLIRP